MPPNGERAIVPVEWSARKARKEASAFIQWIGYVAGAKAPAGQSDVGSTSTSQTAAEDEKCRARTLLAFSVDVFELSPRPALSENVNTCK